MMQVLQRRSQHQLLRSMCQTLDPQTLQGLQVCAFNLISAICYQMQSCLLKSSYIQSLAEVLICYVVFICAILSKSSASSRYFGAASRSNQQHSKQITVRNWYSPPFSRYIFRPLIQYNNNYFFCFQKNVDVFGLSAYPNQLLFNAIKIFLYSLRLSLYFLLCFLLFCSFFLLSCCTFKVSLKPCCNRIY